MESRYSHCEPGSYSIVQSHHRRQHCNQELSIEKLLIFFEAPFNSRYFQPVEKKVSRAALYNDRKDDNQRCGCQHGLARIGHSISNGQGKGHGAT